jgi:hypothetical protein
MRSIWERNLCMRRKLFGGGSPDWYDLGNLESGTRRVIDNQDQVERLLRELTKALPLSALATTGLMANLGEQGVMNMARIDLILFASFLVTTSLPLGLTYTLLLAR